MDAAKLFRLAHVMNFWEGYGFQSVEVPWRVSRESIRATLPAIIGGNWDRRDIYMSSRDDLCLVGSAEQSFIELLSNGTLMRLDAARPLQGNKGRFCAVSPCFRDEHVDRYHRKEFTKVELFSLVDTTDEAVAQIVEMSEIVMADLCRRAHVEVEIATETTDEGFDITINGIEVGSYGIREWRGHKWFYGTALAEPRFTLAMVTLPV